MNGNTSQALKEFEKAKEAWMELDLEGRKESNEFIIESSVEMGWMW